MQSSRAEHQNCAVRSEWNKFISQTDLGSSSISKKIKTMYLCIETLAASCKKKKKKNTPTLLQCFHFVCVQMVVDKPGSKQKKFFLSGRLAN